MGEAGFPGSHSRFPWACVNVACTRCVDWFSQRRICQPTPRGVVSADQRPWRRSCRARRLGQRSPARNAHSWLHWFSLEDKLPNPTDTISQTYEKFKNHGIAEHRLAEINLDGSEYYRETGKKRLTSAEFSKSKMERKVKQTIANRAAVYGPQTHKIFVGTLNAFFTDQCPQSITSGKTGGLEWEPLKADC